MRRTLLTLPFVTLTACSTESPDPNSTIETEEVVYAADGVELRGYLAFDKKKKGKRPGVLVVHEWWGHNDYVRKRARMLAEMGYTALALDMYGEGKNTEHPDDANKFMKEVFANMKAGVGRFIAARETLAGHETTDPEKIAAIGYCFGGAIVLHMARTGMDLDGVASFHGNLATQTPAKTGTVKAAVMVCHGADDSLVPQEQVDAFKKEMATAGVELDFHAYAGAKHGFTNPGATAKGKEYKLPLAYDEKADRESWARLRKFLAGVFE